MADESDRINPRSPVYVYKQLADLLAADIAAGRIPPGAMLPGERALTEQYGVSLNSARHALQLLRDRGLLVTVPAKGTFVVDPLPADKQ